MLKIAWSKCYAHPLPEGHRFPMAKYELLPEQLLHEGTISTDNLFEPQIADAKSILACHDENYFWRLKKLELSKSEIRKMGFPLSAELVHREQVIMQGTIDAALYALQFGISLNIAGGTHHAFKDRGEGFCLLNDIAISAQYLLDNKLRKRILIVDLDVHQGNGTASIFQNEKNVFTFSMHGAKNYPLQKEKSNLDIELPDNIDDAAYLKILKNTLPKISEEFEPDFIFFQSGVDVLKSDKLGRLGLTIEGCKERDRFVLQFCKDNNIPIAVSMGGGYSEKLSEIIEAHANTYRLAQQIFF